MTTTIMMIMMMMMVIGANVEHVAEINGEECKVSVWRNHAGGADKS